MKSNKTLVYEFIHKCTSSASAQETKGVSTQYISDRLNMQRTNISSILNALVKEGAIEKSNGRPVLYKVMQRLPVPEQEASCFGELIGCNGSLKGAVQLAKAAILYPRRSLHSLILGAPGSGKSYFAGLMHRFAIENRIIKGDAPYIRFNCLNYIDNPVDMEKDLLGTEEGGKLAKAEGGVLFIDNIERLPATARNDLLRIVESNVYETDKGKKELNVIIICAMNASVNRSLLDNYNKYFSIKIQLPRLEERTYKERFELIQHFLAIEAERSNKTININPEILIGLLLYHCDRNVKQLKKDIQLGCANAYAREFHSSKKDIVIFMSDFPYHVRTGFLNFKNHREEIKEIISAGGSYTFTKEKTTLVNSSENKRDAKKTMYDWIDEKSNELSARGIEERDINLILSIDIENEFKQYSRRLSDQIVDKEQLSQLVNNKIISLVSDYLEDATKQFNKVYPVSVFYGLCLHLHSTINRQNKAQRLSNEQIMDIIKNNGNEYGFCLKFIGRLEEEFHTKLPIDEVVFLTLFLTRDSNASDAQQRPVLLIALHGDTAAKSIVEVVNFMSGYPAYAYDMSLNTSTETAYGELKQLVLQIHQGKGVLVFYDMGSFKTMLQMISGETGIEIKTMEIPIALLALDCSRKAMIGMSLEEIHREVSSNYQEMITSKRDSNYRGSGKNIILTLCMSGEGAAIQMKSYIEKHLELREIEVIPLAISDKQKLIEEVNQLKEKHSILCVVGSYSPQLIGIRYVPITDLFQNNLSELREIIRQATPGPLLTDKAEEDFEVIFDHLSEELSKVDMQLLRIVLPKAMKDFEEATGYYLSKELELALMIHISCCIQHILEGHETPVNRNKDEIIYENQKLYQEFKRCFLELEQRLSLSFDDNEVSNIISIMKTSREGRSN